MRVNYFTSRCVCVCVDRIYIYHIYPYKCVYWLPLPLKRVNHCGFSVMGRGKSYCLNFACFAVDKAKCIE